MEPEVDYPAAHSMDTTWFAMDIDGHVAVFDSGEPGAVPAGATQDDAWQLTDLPQTSETVFDLTGCRSPVLSERASPRHNTAPDYRHRLLFVDSADAVPAELRALGRMVTTAHPAGVAVYVCSHPELPESAQIHDFLRANTALWAHFVERVHHDGHCLACTWAGADEVVFSRRGLYVYRAHESFYIPEPYGRVAQPTDPLDASDIPSHLRAVAEQRMLPHCFADDTYIQPIEHLDCHAWSAGAYLSEDGSTLRPIPGDSANATELGELFAEAIRRGVHVDETNWHT